MRRTALMATHLPSAERRDEPGREDGTDDVEAPECASPSLAQRDHGTPTRRIDLRDSLIEEATARSADLVGQTVGSYRITGLLGEGGMGAVYAGEHELVNAHVAIKVLRRAASEETNATLYERFVREARAANSIVSPHIVPITDFGRLADGRPYAVMENLRGEPLNVLADRGPLPLDEVIEICRQAAHGLAAAHRQGILHRDIKPENLFIERKPGVAPLVRILDFGIARVPGPADSDRESRMTKVGFVIGTPRFCSPEQAAGRTLTPATDIYSLGAVAYELLTGRSTFEGTSIEILIQKNIDPVRPIRALRPDLPESIAALVMQMLARDPTMRPTTMEDVADRFTTLLGLESRNATATTLVAPSPIANEWRSQDAPPTACTPGAAMAIPMPPQRTRSKSRPFWVPMLGITIVTIGAVSVAMSSSGPSDAGATVEPRAEWTTESTATSTAIPEQTIARGSALRESPASTVEPTQSPMASSGGASARPKPSISPRSSAKRQSNLINPFE